MINFEDLSEEIPDELRPRLDRADPPFKMSRDQECWRENGYLIKERFIPDDLIDAYCAVRERDGEWPTPTPYMQVAEIRALCLFPPLRQLLEQLIGEPMAMNLNLTGWLSTERNWHQDDYLNPPFVNCHYAAVWFALERIDPRSGPFEFVPGSHRWPTLRRERVLRFASAEEWTSVAWPKTTERFVVPAIERKLRQSGSEVCRFLPHKGDILVWHAGLVHRGSPPERPGLPRKALISHYSAISKRKDYPAVHPDGYFIFAMQPDGRGS